MKLYGSHPLRLALALILTFILFASVGAQDEVIKVDTTLVTIPMAVLDREGRYVGDLTSTDFEIYEDGVSREIALFRPVNEPFTAMLVFDASSSMRSYMGEVARAANAFVTQMRPDDQVIVATFSDSRKIKIVVAAVRKKDFKQEVVLGPDRDAGYTATFDAVAGSFDHLKALKGRRAIVLFTDGELFGLKASAKGTLRLAEEQESVVYTVRFGEYPGVDVRAPRGIPTERDKRERAARSDAYLNGLSQRTGGRSYQIDNISDLAGTFRQISDELGRQYYLGYYSGKEADDGRPRLIKVKVKRPGLVIRSRETYSRPK